ncbi:MAG: hypothetical protein RL385_3207 [Pseudomonadota bacterium]|jgi:hypothetical protein
MTDTSNLLGTRNRRGLLLGAALLLGACHFGRATLLNVEHAPLIVSSQVAPSAALVRDAIVKALVERKWQVLQEGQGQVVAAIHVSGHSATVRIDYTPSEFSIHHVESSPGLKFDGVHVHSRYNLWVSGLRDTITRNVVRADVETAGGQSAPAAVTEAAAPVEAPAAQEAQAAPAAAAP